jgi:phosphatidylserine/phosphatidylglycerophosphate/cardiolipin synthase-like enzyme
MVALGRRHLWALLLCLAAAGTGASACSPGAREPEPKSFVFDLTFTTNQQGSPEATCTRLACKNLVREIEGSERTIEFAVYGIRGQDHVIRALAAAERRGVNVRGVVDALDSDCTRFEYSDTPALIDALSPGSVRCDAGPEVESIMHNKFFVFDRQKVWTGSTNVSDTELGGEYNTDVAATIPSPALAAIYGREFEEMFGGRFHGEKADDLTHLLDARHFADGTVVESWFSPSDRPITNGVLPLIHGAQSTLDVAMFFFTSDEIADALISASARGVRVRMILDAEGAASRYSHHPRLCAEGIALKIESFGGKSHAKWAVADAALSDSARVLFGSMNWTKAGDSLNDENTLVVKNPTFAAGFAAEFEREWALLAALPECTRIWAEGADSSDCAPSGDCTLTCTGGACCDGVDNDHDGSLDLEEEACGCADDADNDGDGYVDRDDFDCRPPRDPQ